MKKLPTGAGSATLVSVKYPAELGAEHRGAADGKPLHIFISDVAVKVTGSDTWVEAK
jgi:hypothetical protein